MVIIEGKSSVENVEPWKKLLLFPQDKKVV